jgi:membrane fusion protein, multidrug efflux system
MADDTSNVANSASTAKAAPATVVVTVPASAQDGAPANGPVNGPTKANASANAPANIAVTAPATIQISVQAGAPAALAKTAPAPEPKTAPAPEAKTHPRPRSGESHHAWVWILLALVAVGTVIGVVIYKHQKKPPAKAPPPVTISTTNAAKGDIDVTVERIGTVTPIYTAMISPRVDGQIVRVNYTEGQMVTTNDLLAEIDPGPYQAMLAVAQGQLARDQAMLEGAKIDLDRFKEAFGTPYGTNLHAIPKQQYDDQVALVDQDKGTVKLDEGNVTNAQVQLAYCFIHAPIAGRAGLRLVDPGNVVHAANSNAIVVIAQLQPITVIFSPSEDELPAIQRQLQAGHKMTVYAYDRDKTHTLATGSFLTMDNLIDVATGTFKIKAIFDNADLMLFPNQFVNVKMIIDTLTNVTLIPTPAIQRNPQGAFVYVITNEVVNVTNAENVVTVTNNQIVAMRTITIGITDVDTASVTGLEPGEVIATDNFNKLGDGTRINVRQPGSRGQRGGGRGGAPGGGRGDKKPGGKKNKAQDDAS